MKNVLALVIVAILSGCVEPPTSPAEAAARQWAAADYAARNCAGYIGGFSDVKDLRAEAQKIERLLRSGPAGTPTSRPSLNQHEPDLPEADQQLRLSECEATSPASLFPLPDSGT